MSIQLFSGVPGSGKSYHAVLDIVFALKHGKYIYTNIELNFKAVAKAANKKLVYVKEHIFYRDTYDITISDIVFTFRRFVKGNKEHQFLLVLDEAGDIFNPREWKSADRLDWLKFFRLHRHFYIDVILVAQSDDFIDKQIRGVVELESEHVNAKHYKLMGLILSFVFGGLFVCKNSMYNAKLRTDTDWIIRRKKICKCYDTFALSIDYYSAPGAVFNAPVQSDNPTEQKGVDNID